MGGVLLEMDLSTDGEGEGDEGEDWNEEAEESGSKTTSLTSSPLGERRGSLPNATVSLSGSGHLSLPSPDVQVKKKENGRGKGKGKEKGKRMRQEEKGTPPAECNVKKGYSDPAAPALTLPHAVAPETEAEAEETLSKRKCTGTMETSSSLEVHGEDDGRTALALFPDAADDGAPPLPADGSELNAPTLPADIPRDESLPKFPSMETMTEDLTAEKERLGENTNEDDTSLMTDLPTVTLGNATAKRRKKRAKKYPRTPWSFVAASVGDCKIFHYSLAQDKVSDATFGNRMNVTNARLVFLLCSALTHLSHLRKSIHMNRLCIVNLIVKKSEERNLIG